MLTEIVALSTAVLHLVQPMSMIQPLENRVIILPSEPESKTPGGILLPDNAQDRPTRGVVVAVGPGKRVNGQLEPTLVCVGDEVIYDRYEGKEISHDGQKFRIMTDNFILGIIQEVEEAEAVPEASLSDSI